MTNSNLQESKNLEERLSPKHKAVYNILKERTKRLLEYNQINARNYPTHSVTHAENVIKILNKMIPSSIAGNFTSTEVLILLCSAWLHDIGMLKDKMGSKPLSPEEVREHHHELSYEHIIKNHEELGFDDISLARMIAEVCLCHSRKIDILRHFGTKKSIQDEEYKKKSLELLKKITSDKSLELLKKITSDKSLELLKKYAPDQFIELFLRTYALDESATLLKEHAPDQFNELLKKYAPDQLFEKFLEAYILDEPAKLLKKYASDEPAKLLKKYASDEPTESLFLKTYIFDESARLTLLSALLRLADALDTDSRRAPHQIYSETTTLPEENEVHWRACNLISGIGFDIDNTRIVIDAFCTNEDEERILLWKLGHLFEEYESVREIIIRNELIYYEMICRIEKKNKLGIIPEKEKKEIYFIKEMPDLSEEEKPLPVIIGSLEKGKRYHEKKKEFVFAADFSHRAARACEKMGEKLEKEKEKLGKEMEKLRQERDRLEREEQIDLIKRERKIGELRKEIEDLGKEIENLENEIGELWKKAINYYIEARKYVEKEGEESRRMYFLRFLRHYFNEKVKNLLKKLQEKQSGLFEEFLVEERDLLNEGLDEKLLKEGERIAENLDLLERDYPKQNLFSMLQVFLQAGRSPERKKIRERFESIKKEKQFEDDGSVHDGCCLCTAECIGDYLLAQKKEEVKKSLEWLKKQKKYGYKILRLKKESREKYKDLQSLDKEECEERDKVRGDHYTAEVLEISLFAGDEDFQWDVAETLLENVDTWEEPKETDSLYQLANVFYTLDQFVKELKRRDEKENKEEMKRLENLLRKNEDEPLCKKIGENIEKFVGKFEEEPLWTRRNIVHGLLIPDFCEIIIRIGDELCKELSEELRTHLAEMNERAQKTLSYILEDPVYEKMEYLWATDLDHTRDWTLNWLRYWEYCLERREKEQD